MEWYIYEVCLGAGGRLEGRYAALGECHGLVADGTGEIACRDGDTAYRDGDMAYRDGDKECRGGETYRLCDPSRVGDPYLDTGLCTGEELRARGEQKSAVDAWVEARGETWIE